MRGSLQLTYAAVLLALQDRSWGRVESTEIKHPCYIKVKNTEKGEKNLLQCATIFKCHWVQISEKLYLPFVVY